MSKCIGQQNLRDEIYQSILADHFAHANLLYGSMGYGVLALAWDIAQLLLCNKPSEKGACGQCGACIKVNKTIHPDLHFSFPVVSKEGIKRKDTISDHFIKAWREMLSTHSYFSLTDWLQHIVSTSARPDINVAECNHIIKNLSLQASAGGAKVQIIWMAEYLGNNANRLLKLIEEPPANTYLILCCQSTEGVLNTITSRCRTFRLPPIEEAPLEEALMARHGVTHERAQQLSLLSEGDYATAVAYLDVDDSHVLDTTLTWLRLLSSGDVAQLVTWVDQFHSLGGHEKKAILTMALRVCRTVFENKVMGHKKSPINTNYTQKLEKQNFLKDIPIEALHYIVELLNEALFLLDRNIHSKVLLFDLSLKIEKMWVKSVTK